MSEAEGAVQPTGGRITLRYWASLRAAAGVDSDPVATDDPVTLADLQAHARSVHESRKFADVLSTCSVLVDDRPANRDDPGSVVVRPGQTVEFLPPFAGG